MKRGIAIALVLAGCTATDDGPAEPPPDELPPGVWQPMPGADIWDASLAVDGDSLWWATTRRTEPAGEYLYKDEIWLSSTSLAGLPIVEPARVAPDSGSSFYPDVLVTPAAIVAKAGGVQTLLRRYDRAGAPLGEPYPVVIDADYTNVNEMALISTATGGAQLVASLQADAAEVAIVDLDADGVAGATRVAGTPDTAEGGTVAGSISAAARPDGSTLVAWDRGYNACISTRPSSTLTTSIDGASVGAIQTVRDLPDSEHSPVIATSGAGAYIAWLSSSAEGTRISLARHADPATVIAEVGDPAQYNVEPLLVLAGPDRGAIAWRTHLGTELYVVPFEDLAGTVHVGTPRVIAPVDPESGAWTVGFAHVGDDRYVLGWIEAQGSFVANTHRLYAMELDLGDRALRPAPPVVPTTSVAPRRLRCP